MDDKTTQDVGVAGGAPTTSARGANPMATLITGERLQAALGDNGFIKGGVLTSVEGVKYDFRVSSRILKASFGRPIDIDGLSQDQQVNARVDPGEVVFVRTIETLDLPDNIIATLSPKRKVSHSGIIVLCGFAIDPLYKGPLWVGLYNFSSTPFPLQPGKKLIAAMFYELAGLERAAFISPEASTDADFPDELVTLIRNYKPIELRSLIDQVAEAQRRIDALTSEVRDDRSWKNDFKEALEKQSREIDKLLDGLREEKIAREREDERLRGRLDSMSSLFTTSRIIWAIVIFFVGVSVTVGAEYFVTKWFK